MLGLYARDHHRCLPALVLLWEPTPRVSFALEYEYILYTMVPVSNNREVP